MSGRSLSPGSTNAVPRPRPRIVPAGDSAVIVEFEERVDPGVNARAIALADAIAARRFEGLGLDRVRILRID